MKETDGQGYDQRLIRAFHGVCPHCGKELAWKKHSGRVFAEFMKICPDNHFAIEYHGRGVVTYHDREGDPIDYLFGRNFKLLRNEEQDRITTRKVPKPDDEVLESEPEPEIEDE